MTFRSAGVVPPTELVDPAPSNTIPVVFPTAAVPAAFVPMKFPRTDVFVIVAPTYTPVGFPLIRFPAPAAAPPIVVSWLLLTSSTPA